VAAAWAAPVGTADLPHWIDPPGGFVASANDRPPDGAEGPAVPVGFFFSPAERVRRMRDLLGGTELLGPEDMVALQADVRPPNAPKLRDLLLARVGPADGSAIAALRAWDGSYLSESAGALVFEVMLAELAARLGRSGAVAATTTVWTTRLLLAEDIAATSDAQLRPALHAAVQAAGRALRRYRYWGAMHRMRMRHHLGALPLLGRRFSYGGWPSPGGNDTLNKTGHAPARTCHEVTFGASARFIADLSDPDANRVVLLGGQDGWLGSTTFLDQATLWRRGEAIVLPLRPETARAWPFHTVLTPAG